MKNRSWVFPWFFFWKVLRLQAFVQIIVFLAIWFSFPAQAMQFAPFMVGGFLLFVLLFLFIALPLKDVLVKVGQYIDLQFAHHQQLDLFYQKDEWAQISAAIEESHTKLSTQLQNLADENAKFTTLLESLQLPILAIDSKQTILFSNSAFNRRFYNHRPAVQLKLWSIIDNDILRKAFQEVVETQVHKEFQLLDFPLDPKASFYLTIAPLQSSHASFKGVIGIFNDITEARKLAQMRSDFVANVSHELRTPLTTIKGSVQILKNQKSRIPDDLADFVYKISENADRMITLFNELLDLSTIESQSSLKKETLSLSEILKNAHHQVLAHEWGKTMTLSLPPEDCEIYAHKKLMEQVFINLLENAIKYGPEFTTINITSKKENGFISVSLQDNGPGIPREHQDRVFERFYRVETSRQRSTHEVSLNSLKSGTGLGLAIVKHIIQKHGGDITLNSQENQGCTFIISLPIYEN
jgi:two-component system phosphate regulon sensor histidine kinase PhoR